MRSERLGVACQRANKQIPYDMHYFSRGDERVLLVLACLALEAQAQGIPGQGMVRRDDREHRVVYTAWTRGGVWREGREGGKRPAEKTLRAFKRPFNHPD